jgi:hypothetical protein
VTQLLVALGLLSGVVRARRHDGGAGVAAESATAVGPSFPIGGPSSTAWREEMLTKAHELAGLATWVEANRNRAAPAGALPKAVANQLRTARLTAAGEDTRGGQGRKRPRLWTRLMSASGGASFERTLGNLDAAEVNLLRLAPPAYLAGQLPGLHAHVNRYLPKDDPRRVRVATLVAEGTDELSPADHNVLISAYHAANSQRRRDLLRLRSFRNLLVGAFLTLLVLAITLAVLGNLHPNWFPMCFLPEDKHRFVCPLVEVPVANPATAKTDALVAQAARGADVLLVEIVGLIAATLAGALALRRMRGTSTPYGVPVSLILLKLPTGALTAVLGLLFIRGGFVPGLSALDSSGQILAWAIVFGYAQQTFTRLIDSQGNDLLHDVAGRGAAGDRETRSH